MQELVKVYEEQNLDLFPFYFWADSWGRFTNPILGRDMGFIFFTIENSATKYYAYGDELSAMAEGLLQKFLDGLEAELEEKNTELYGQMQKFGESISKADLGRWNNAQLSTAYRQFHELMYGINGYGMIYAFLEYPESKVSEGLEEYLQKQAGKTGAKTPVGEAFAALTSPTAGTMLRELQEKILLIACDVNSDADCRELFRQPAEEVEKTLPGAFPDLSAKLDELTREYCWINWGYVGPAMPKSYFISEVKQALEQGKPEKKLDELRKADGETAAKQKRVLEEFQIDEYYAKRFRLCSSLTRFKGFRKENIYRAFYQVDKLQREIAKRLSLTAQQARYFLPEEVYAALENGSALSADAANERRAFCGYLIQDGNVSLLDGKQSQKWLALVEKEESFENLSEIKGSCACPGNAEGIVRVVLNASEVAKVLEGDVLVSWSTNPNMVPGMRRASAIVTEMGGVASHAAIVSREFKIPCIVGAKGATRALKDGDRVQVDATQGIVRKVQ